MRCAKCRKPARYKIQSMEVCPTCFQEIIEKRIRKEIRLNKLVSKNDRLLILDDGSGKAGLLLIILKRILKGLPYEAKISKRKGDCSSIVLPWTADDEISNFLGAVFKGIGPKHTGHYLEAGRRHVKPLISITNSEIDGYAAILGSKIRLQSSPFLKELDLLEKDYPEVRYSLLSSIRDIRGNAQ